MIPDRKHAEFTLRPSLSLLLYSLVFLVSIAVVFLMLPLPLWIKLPGILLVGFCACHSLVQFNRQQPQTLRCLDTQWQLIVDGQHKTLTLCSSQFIASFLIIVYFRTDEGPRLSRVIPWDSMVADQHRQLRMLLLNRVQ